MYKPDADNAVAPVNRPTMEDVARKANVSRALVSLVMNDAPNVSEGKRRSVLEAARQLGYRPNLAARQLAQKRTHSLGVLVNDLRNPFFGEVVDGIEAAANEHGFQILILNGRRDVEHELAAVETFLQLRVEGLLLLGPRISDDDLARFGAIAPCVVVASGLSHPGVDTVVTDGFVGAKLAVEHLQALGHHRIVHIDGADNASAAERRDGYCEAMHHGGLDALIDIRRGGDDEVDALAVVDDLLAESSRPTAIFAFNDLLAAGALDRLDKAGLHVPGDVSLVGFDNTFISGLRRFSLTTVNQPTEALGRLAVRTLLQRLGDGAGEPIRHTLQPELVVRATTAQLLDDQGAPLSSATARSHA